MKKARRKENSNAFCHLPQKTHFVPLPRKIDGLCILIVVNVPWWNWIHSQTNSLLENLGLWACKWWKALYLIASTHFKMRKHILHSTLIKFTFKYHKKNVSYEEFIGIRFYSFDIVKIWRENRINERNSHF